MSEITSEKNLNQPKGLPFRISFEPRLEEPPRWFPFLVSFFAIIVALFLGGIIILIAGGDPIKTYAHIGRASFGNLGVFSDTIVKATPLILVGLACSVAFRSRL